MLYTKVETIQKFRGEHVSLLNVVLSRPCHDAPMFISLIYVSRRTSDRVVPQAEMDELTAVWSERNARLRVRGALLVANRHVAQILEGPEEAVDGLLANARLDPRITDITVIERRPIDGYRFTDWCFAYWGTASYMDQKIATVLDKQRGGLTKLDIGMSGYSA